MATRKSVPVPDFAGTRLATISEPPLKEMKVRKLLPLVVSSIAAISFSALAADYSDKTQTQDKSQGRSVDTGGGRPDSSKAEGAAPVTSPSAGAQADTSADSSAGADKPGKETGKEKRAERKAKRDAQGNATSGASTDPSTSTPGSPGSPSSGGTK
jgi:hypothetical protein